MKRANLLRSGDGDPVEPWMVWWRAGELNPRPLRCERSALPTELAPHSTVLQFVIPMPHIGRIIHNRFLTLYRKFDLPHCYDGLITA